MLLNNRYPEEEWKDFTEHYCKITEKLDELAGFTNKDGEYFDVYSHYGYRHYVLYTKTDANDGILALRVPGGTVGGISFTKDHVITDIKIDTNYVVRTYVKDVNEQLQQFIGQTLEIPF